MSTSLNRKSIPLAEANLDQMREFASNVLGLRVAANIGEDTLRARIAEAHNGSEINVTEAGQEPAPQTGTPPTPPAAAKQKEETRRILIQEQEGAGGRDPVPVSVNGTAMLIPRGKPVDVPARYVEALTNAVQWQYDTDEEGRMLPDPRKVPSYPYSVVA